MWMRHAYNVDLGPIRLNGGKSIRMYVEDRKIWYTDRKIKKNFHINVSYD